MESKEKIRVSLLLDRDLVETADKIMKERGYIVHAISFIRHCLLTQLRMR